MPYHRRCQQCGKRATVEKTSRNRRSDRCGRISRWHNRDQIIEVIFSPTLKGAVGLIKRLGSSRRARLEAEARIRQTQIELNSGVDGEVGFAGRRIRDVVPGKFSREIDAALRSTDSTIQFEGQLGKALDDQGVLLDFQSKLTSGFSPKGSPNGIGEVDAETPKFIIEATLGKKKAVDQLQKLVGNMLLNPERKPVILLAPNITSPQQRRVFERLNVSLVNSVDELLQFGVRNGGL